MRLAFKKKTRTVTIEYRKPPLIIRKDAEGNEPLFFFSTIGFCEINFVHQLQSLYFALTGQELTLTK